MKVQVRYGEEFTQIMRQAAWAVRHTLDLHALYLNCELIEDFTGATFSEAQQASARVGIALDVPAHEAAGVLAHYAAIHRSLSKAEAVALQEATH